VASSVGILFQCRQPLQHTHHVVDTINIALQDDGDQKYKYFFDSVAPWQGSTNEIN
jgi:hypothetical protein